MRILPRRTRPFRVKLDRRHTPRLTRGRRGYQALRPCLRWEFGFTCAFCLAHESDLAEHGAEGTGLMTIEHFSPASAANSPAEVEALVNDYRNCFYACRYCNGSRNAAPEVDRRGRKLLNPCSHAWGEHFILSDDDRLLPVPGDLDAEYTAEAYDLNEARKLEMRRSRRQRTDESLALIDQGPGLLDALLASSMRLGPGARSAALLMAAESLRKAMLNAEQSLMRHAAIPEDADIECRCGHGDNLSLPPALEEQTIDIDFAG
jgi:hypothetical protein